MERLLESLDKDYVDGLTILGGEPLEPENQPQVLGIIETVRQRFPEKNIWLYTGFEYANIYKTRAYTPYLNRILSQIDVLVDGPFVLSKRDITLKFRGSTNQRLIDMRKTLKTGSIILLGDTN